MILKLLLLNIYLRSVFSKDYHVDCEGNDDNNGIFDNPWKTIEKVNTEIINGLFEPCDTIQFKKSCKWKESLKLYYLNGNNSCPIRITSYGRKSLSPPSFDGSSTIISSFELHQESTYFVQLNHNNMKQVFVDNEPYLISHLPTQKDEYFYIRDNEAQTSSFSAYDNFVFSRDQIIGSVVVIRARRWVLWGSKVLDYDPTSKRITIQDSVHEKYTFRKNYGFKLTNKLFMLSNGSWFFDNDTKLFYIWMKDNSNPNDHEVKYTNLQIGIEVYSSNYLIIENFNIQFYQKYGISVYKSNDILIQNCEIENISKYGMFILSGSEKRIVIRNNIINNIARKGIFVGYGISFLEISQNDIQNIMEFPMSILQDFRYDWAIGAGLHFGGGKNSIITENNINNTGYSSVTLGGSNNTVSFNLLQNNCKILDDGGISNKI